MFMMKSETTEEACFVTVGDVQGVRSPAIEWWARQTMGMREADYFTSHVAVAYDDDQLTMTAQVILWTV